MKKICLLLLVFVLETIAIQAQNLVPNFNFEELRDLPVKPNPRNSYQYEPLSGYRPFQYNLNYWFAGTESTPDLRITDLKEYNICRKRYDDCDRAKSGIISAGIITYQQNKKHNAYREYIEIKLKDALEIGKITHVEFWIRKERQAKLVSNNIGCYFSEKKIYAETEEVIKLSPQINCDSIINSDQTKWVKIESTFVPDKAYRFIVIGNFFSNQETKIETYEDYNGSPYTPPYAYYLIDDIKVWHTDSLSTVAPKPVPKSRPKEEILSLKPNKKIILNQLKFEYNSALLDLTSTIELDKLITVLNENPHYKVKVIGHTDNRGSEIYNQGLSENRAKAVVDYLITNGISSHLLSYKGLGEQEPIVSNDSEGNRHKNRRVEIIIIEDK